MEEASYKLPKEFVHTVVVVLSLIFQYILTTYLVTYRARIGAFRGRFMKQFNAEHKKAFPEKEKAPEFGYPDSGNGRFAKKLDYKDWFEMANGQRCQINFLEHLNFAILAPLLISLNYP